MYLAIHRTLCYNIYGENKTTFRGVKSMKYYLIIALFFFMVFCLTACITSADGNVGEEISVVSEIEDTAKI